MKENIPIGSIWTLNNFRDGIVICISERRKHDGNFVCAVLDKGFFKSEFIYANLYVTGWRRIA